MIETTLNGLVLTLGEEECYGCRPDFPGKRVDFPLIDCPKCKGTGRRGSGRCRNCKPLAYERVPAGKMRDYANPFVVGECGQCHGTNVVPATMTDSLPGGVVRQIVEVTGGLRVHVREGDLTWGEAHLGYVADDGLSALWSSVDYGRTWGRLAAAAREERLTAELAAFKAELTERVATDRVQACKVATDDGVVCRFVAVLVARNGYTVVGVKRDEEERAAALAAEAERIAGLVEA